MNRMICFILCTIPLHAAVSIEQYHSHDFAFSAPVRGNPFDVTLTGEFRGPDGIRLRVPGFYDGGGVWKIRFSPARQGQWSLRTVASQPELDAKSETITSTANRNPNIHGGLRVDPAHPYHFVYEDGTRYFLLGYQADWLWGAGILDPERRLMHTLIRQIASRGFNHLLVNVYAHDTRWSPERKHEWDWGPPDMFPWEGTNEKPDHSRLNPRFFQAYDRMMEALRERGIVAHIMIKVYNKMVNWPEPWSADEERYFRYVVSRYQGFSNVVWDFSKEAQNEKDNRLQRHLMERIRHHDAYRRLVTVHDDDAFYEDPEFNTSADFRTDQQHTHWEARLAFDRALRRYPVLNSEFGYERGMDGFPTYRVVHEWQEQLRRAWLVYLAGGYGVYYYHNTAWDVVKPEPEPPGMERFAILKKSLSSLPYWRMEPANHLADGAPCLVREGEAYACFIEGEQVKVNLRALDGTGQPQWLNTWTGEQIQEPAIQPGVHRFRKPEPFGKAPALLRVVRLP